MHFFIFRKFRAISLFEDYEFNFAQEEISLQYQFTNFWRHFALLNFLLSPRRIPASKIVNYLLNFEIPMGHTKLEYCFVALVIFPRFANVTNISNKCKWKLTERNSVDNNMRNRLQKLKIAQWKIDFIEIPRYLREMKFLLNFICHQISIRLMN